MQVYLDGHATTPLAPEARDAMLAAWAHTGNPHSNNVAGGVAAATVEHGRASISRLIGVSPAEVVFTSGATEANNLSILGAARASESKRRRRIVVSALEHKSVLGAADSLRRQGFEVVRVQGTPEGIVDLDAVRAAVDDRTLLVSVMAANNETGVVQPVAKVAEIAREFGALVHCDAAQAFGKIPLSVADLGVDYLSMSSHKIYGPFGIGALFISADATPLPPLMFGGGQEGAIRPGTVAAPLVAGFAAAADVACARQTVDCSHSQALRERFVRSLAEAGVRFRIIGNSQPRLPGSLGIVLGEADADSLVDRLGPVVTLSSGSACTSGVIGPSHVLTGMGLSNDEAKSFVRLYFGRYNTLREVDRAAKEVADALMN